jgi:hypothetical protein
VQAPPASRLAAQVKGGARRSARRPYGFIPSAGGFGSCGFVKTIVSPVLNAGNGDFISALHVAKIPPDTKMIPIALKLSVGTSIPACFAPHNPTALTTDPAPEEMNPEATP